MYDFEEPKQIGQQILQLMLTNPEPRSWLSSIARWVGECFEVDFSLAIADLSPRSRVSAGVWPKGLEETLSSEGPGQPLCHPPWLAAMAAENPLIVEDLQEASLPIPELKGLQALCPVRALLAVPVGDGGRVKGQLVLGRNRPHKWSLPEIEALQRAAEAIVLPYNQLQLQQQVQTRDRYQTLLSHLSDIIHHNAELEPMLDRALAETAQALQVERGWALSLKYADPLRKNRQRQRPPKAKVMVVGSWLESPAENESLKEQGFSLSNCPLCSQAWQSAPQLLAIADRSRWPQPSSLDVSPQAAWLIAPLMGRASNDSDSAAALGFLVFQDRHPRPWQNDELEVVKWVSAQISAAMIHQQTLRQVQSLVDERTAQLKWSLELQAKLSEKMRQQIDELKQANQIKDEFLATVQDELKHPLAKMKMAIEMLKIAPDPEKRQRYLNILETECTKETQLIIDLLTLQQLKANQFSTAFQKLNLRDILDELPRSFESRWAEKGLNLAIAYHPAPQAQSSQDSTFVLYTDPNSLSRILSELLSNAGKFSEPDTIVCLEVRRKLRDSGPQIMLTLTNFGSCLSPEERQEMFKSFTQIRRQEGTEQGTGLGLALVKSLVEHLNGAIAVDSHPSENPTIFATSFTLTFPQFLSPPE